MVSRASCFVDSDRSSAPVAISTGADELKTEPVILALRAIFEEQWRLTENLHQDIDITVVVVVTECRPPRRPFRTERRTQSAADVLEAPMLVSQHQERLTIADSPNRSFDP